MAIVRLVVASIAVLAHCRDPWHTVSSTYMHMPHAHAHVPWLYLCMYHGYTFYRRSCYESTWLVSTA